MLLMSSSLLLLQCSVHLNGMVCETGGKWLYSWCFVRWCFQDLFKTTHKTLVLFSSSVFKICKLFSRTQQILNCWNGLFLLRFHFSFDKNICFLSQIKIEFCTVNTLNNGLNGCFLYPIWFLGYHFQYLSSWQQAALLAGLKNLPSKKVSVLGV